MNIMEEDWTAFVRYRLEKAEETYLAAQIIDKVKELLLPIA